jgi:FixJ family two-component response regulator
MDGRELAEHLKSRRPDLRVICISAQPAGISALQETLPAGVVFMGKPFRKREFINKVHEVLDAE